MDAAHEPPAHAASAIDVDLEDAVEDAVEGHDGAWALSEIIAQLRCEPDLLDVDSVRLDLRNGDAVRTILRLLLASKECRDDERILRNFIVYVVHDLVRLDDFDMKLLLAEALQEFVPRLCSRRHTGRLLVQLCEQFLQPEDSVIKEEAFKLVALLLEHLHGDDVGELLALVQRIFENEWSQCTGIDLMAICFPRVSEEVQRDYRERFVQLMSDDASLAKAAMARNYASIVRHCPREVVESEAIAMLQQLTDDIQVPARRHSVEIAIAIASVVEEDLIDRHLSAVFEQLARDAEWKVRMEVAVRIVDIQRAVRPQMARILIVALLRTLCVDREATVRKCLATNVVGVVIQFKETAAFDLRDIFDVIDELNRDASEDVRDHLMRVMMDCAGHLSREECRAHLLPLVQHTLVRHSVAGTQLVQEQCVHNLNKLIAVLGYEAMQPEIERCLCDVLAAKSQWRARRRLVMTLNILALNASREYFTAVCLPFYKQLLSDACHAVRRIVPMILPVLLGQFGFEWGRTHVLSYVFSFHDHPTAFQRLLVLYAIEELVSPSLANIPHAKFARKLLLRPSMRKDYLYKVYSLSEMLRYKLEQVESHIGSEREPDASVASDLHFYGEDLTDEFAACELPAEDVLDLLTFVIKHIIPVLANYLNDKVINVVNRAIHTYQLVAELQRRITAEFQLDDFRDLPSTFSKESRRSIESSILQELTQVDGRMEEKVEHAVRGKQFEAGVRLEDVVQSKDTLSNTTETNTAGGNHSGDIHLLDDVDMQLFDAKKTVLEFYSDATNDAINI